MVSDRIRLAEAMGWQMYPAEGQTVTLDPNKRIAFRESDLPDPFTDANDDYAVLEWMRCKPGHTHDWDRFIENLPAKGLHTIGDYARAALKVIDGGE